MTCRCNCLSPFRWAEFPQSSIFTGRAFTSDDSGTASRAVQAFEDKTGRSRGTVFGISKKSDEKSEEFQRQIAMRRAA